MILELQPLDKRTVFGFAPDEAMCGELTAECGAGSRHAVSADGVPAESVNQVSGPFGFLRINHTAVMEKVREPEAVIAVSGPAGIKQSDDSAWHDVLCEMRNEVCVCERSPECINVADIGSQLSAGGIRVGIFIVHPFIKGHCLLLSVEVMKVIPKNPL